MQKITWSISFQREHIEALYYNVIIRHEALVPNYFPKPNQVVILPKSKQTASERSETCEWVEWLFSDLMI